MRHLSKRFLSLALVLMMVLSMVPVTTIAEDIATVTEIDGTGMTFAVNFTANDLTEEQIATYGSWNVDVELIVNKDITIDGTNPDECSYIAGAYGLFNMPDLTVLPITVDIPANNPWGLIRYTGSGDLDHSLNSFKVWTTGISYAVKFSDAFLAANPDLEATVQLKLYHPEDESQTLVLASYSYPEVKPELPTATVSSIINDDLTFAMNFKTDEVTDEQLAYYGEWFTDFELTVNKDVTFYCGDDTTVEADGYLAGRYDNEYTGNNWLNVPFDAPVSLKANEPLKVMAYAADAMGDPDLEYTFKDVYEAVKDFSCGIYFTPEFLAANPDLEVTLELKMYNPLDKTESVVIGNAYSFTPASKLPTATITNVANKDLTFAMNFKADEVTDEQLEYYKNWYTDFELTINKDVTFDARGGADGYLSGQYENTYTGAAWVNVPYNKSVTLEANKTLKIMAFAAELMGEPGLKYTYGEVYEAVKDFNCGAYFTPEFLAANPDLEVTLELKMYNPADESEDYIIGRTYTFNQTNKLPTATVTEIQKDGLTFAMNFKADEVSDDQLEYHKKWYADFELTVNKDVTFYCGDDTTVDSDGYLSGQYENTYTGTNWVNVPFEEAVTLKANEPLRIMAYAAEAMGEPGLKYTYGEVYEFVKDFNCGVYFTPEFLEANPDLEVNLELKMYKPTDENENYIIGETYVFTVGYVAYNVDTETYYTDVSAATESAKDDETVILLRDAEDVSVAVLENTVFDLNGYKLTTEYMSVFGDLVDNSDDNGGVLIVPNSRFLTQENNAQLPVRIADGQYQFVEVLGFNKAVLLEGTKYAFQPIFEPYAHELLLEGQEATGVTINVRVNWTQSQGQRYQDFVYNDDQVAMVINSYNPTTGKYGQMYTLTMSSINGYKNLTYTAVVVSACGVKCMP